MFTMHLSRIALLAVAGAAETECRVATDGEGCGTVGLSFFLRGHDPDTIEAAAREIRIVPIPPGKDVTVFTAGVESIQQWWQSLAGLQSRLTAATTAEMAKDLAREIFSVKLTCALAGFMLVLSGLIVIDAARRWVVILGGQSKAAVELAPAADSGGRT